MPSKRPANRFRLHRLSVALSGLCVVTANVAGAELAAKRVTVKLVLLSAPSVVETTTDLESVGPGIGSQSQVTPGKTAFLEAWCQTPGPNPITTAIIDLTYETAFLDTTTSQVSLANQWATLPFAVSVDDSTGFVDDLGGNNFGGLGAAPDWAKIGTVAFDVASTPSTPVVFCSLFSGKKSITFAILSEGLVPPAEVSYECLTIGCSVDADCDDQNPCTIDSCDSFVGCLQLPDDALCDDGLFCNGPESCSMELGGCVPGMLPCLPDREVCDPAMEVCLPVSVPGDTDGDDDVDLADISMIFNCFGQKVESGGPCDLAELNGDMVVDQLDIDIAISNVSGP